MHGPTAPPHLLCLCTPSTFHQLSPQLWCDKTGMATPTLDTSWYMAGSVARKPQGLCAPHVVPFNLLGRFPGGAQSLTAETLLSLSRHRQRERERQAKGRLRRGRRWVSRELLLVWGAGLSPFLQDKELSLRERQKGALGGESGLSPPPFSFLFRSSLLLPSFVFPSRSL